MKKLGPFICSQVCAKIMGLFLGRYGGQWEWCRTDEVVGLCQEKVGLSSSNRKCAPESGKSVVLRCAPDKSVKTIGLGRNIVYLTCGAGRRPGGLCGRRDATTPAFKEPNVIKPWSSGIESQRIRKTQTRSSSCSVAVGTPCLRR